MSTMTISYKVKGIMLNEFEMYEIGKYYEAACTAEYIIEKYGIDEELAMEIGYEVRRKMNNHGYYENEAIQVVFTERGIDINSSNE